MRLSTVMIALLSMSLLACGADSTPSTSANSSTADGEEFWAVDAGTSGASDTTKGGGDAKGDDVDKTCYDGCIKKGQSTDVCTQACPSGGKGGGKGGDVDKTCYDGCIKKGQSTDVCTKACPSGGKGGGKGGGKDNQTFDYDTCYKGCTAKKLGEDACKKGCKCSDDCVKAGGESNGCIGKCFNTKQDPPYTGKHPECYDGCKKSGGGHDVCNKGCDCFVPCKADEQAKCVKAGGSEADCKNDDNTAKYAVTCKPKCFTGGGKGGGKGGGTGEACYNQCVKDGGTPADCKTKCFDQGGGKGDPPKTVWGKIHQDVILGTGCAGGYCHGSSPWASKDADTSYKALMAAKSTKSKCTAMDYITAGDPSKSLFYLKIAPNETHGCGDKMPKGGKAVPADHVATIKKWITDGAKLK